MSPQNAITNTQKPLIQVRDLAVQYEGDEALEDVSVDIYAGQSVAIIGPNGAGKSTLIKAIMGLVTIKAGTVQVQNGGQHRLGYVPQHDAVDWDAPVTVRDVVMMGLAREIGWFRWPGRRHWDQVHQALDRVQLGEFAGRQINDLSGGQRRRVFIARALAQRSDVLLLDEPFAGVDVAVQTDLMDILDVLHSEGLTILLSTHDLGLAFNRFDLVVALRRHLIACGPPDEVYVPETLSQLYGGRLATWNSGQQVMVFVDDHH